MRSAARHTGRHAVIEVVARAPIAIAVLLAIAVASTAVACSRGEGKAAAAAEDPDWGAYRRALAPLAQDERAALAAVAERTGAGYTDDAALSAALRDVALPRYRAYVAGLKQVTPPPAAADVHARLTTLAERELAVLERIERAVDRRDGTAVLSANREHRALRVEIEALLGDVRAARAKPARPQELPAAAGGAP